jgi:hypothetical protein
VTPDQREMSLAADETRPVLDMPGQYQLRRAQGSDTVAVNLPPAESDTAPLAPDRLESLGVRLGDLESSTDLADRERQMRDVELESRQKLWQWMVVAAIAVLGLESTLAGRAAAKLKGHAASAEP